MKWKGYAVVQHKSLQAVTWGGEPILRTAEKQRENVLWSAQTGWERTAGQCHSPGYPPSCWQMESFLRGETRITRSFLMTVVHEAFVLSLLCNKLVCKGKEISYWFSHKFPFETDCFISNQCCLIVPALGSQSQNSLTWGFWPGTTEEQCSC